VPYFVGLDVSLDETAICVIDDADAILKEGKAETEPDAIIAWLSATDGSIERLGLEAGPLSPWLYEGRRGAGVPAICIETRRMKGATAVMIMAVKTDRNDARAIAQAMRVGWFTAVHVKTAESQELRLLLTNRKTLQTSRVKLENEICGTLKAFGLKVGRVSTVAFEMRVIELTGDNICETKLGDMSIRNLILSLHRGSFLAAPTEFAAVRPDAMQDHGELASDRNCCPAQATPLGNCRSPCFQR
jgi:transposase